MRSGRRDRPDGDPDSLRESGRGLLITVEDNGVGISAEDKKRLFERGFGHNTGLGLFLSREILAITGITITRPVNPVRGRGSRSLYRTVHTGPDDGPDPELSSKNSPVTGRISGLASVMTYVYGITCTRYSRYPLAKPERLSFLHPRIRMWNHWMNRTMNAIIPYIQRTMPIRIQ